MSQESQELTLDGLRQAWQGAPLGVLLIARGDARLLYANPQIERMLGYGAGALAGLTLDLLLPQATALVLGDWPPAADTLRREVLAMHRGGQAVPVAISLSPLRLGAQACVLAYITDRTASLRLHRQMDGIIAAMPQGLMLVDEAGLIRQTNPALEAQFGYAPGALLGQPLETLLPERLRKGHAQLFAGFLSAPQLRQMGSGRDLTALHRSGVEFPVEVALNSVETETGRLALAVISDITPRKSAEDALRQTNAQLEEFTYVASHDLRSPLRGIADLLSWIHEDLPPEALTASVTQNFERARVRIERCERMIEDLLDYARAGQREKRTALLDPRAAIEEACLTANVPPDFEVQIRVDSQPFRTSVTPLALALRNLIGNAVKHHGGSGGGRIRVSAQDAGRFAVFTVEDDGQGVPAGAQERIFKLFHRANDQVEGHGVGLAVTRRLVHAHGGSIVVQPSADLGGACFRIHWPRVAMKEVEKEVDDE